MTRVLLARFLQMVPVVLLVSFATMSLLYLVPGDPVYSMLGGGERELSPEEVARVREDLGLDRSLPVRYVSWLAGALQGDLGTSYRTGEPVSSALASRAAVTLELTAVALLIIAVTSIPTAMIAAHRRGKLFDRVTNAVCTALIAVPPFLLALVLVFLLAVTYRIFPVTGWVPLTRDVTGNIRSVLLPALALACREAAIWHRLFKDELTRTLRKDFVTTARARGLPPRKVLVRHAFRPSSFSLLTIVGLTIGQLISGAIVIEVIFALPGLGQLMVTSVFERDYVMLQGLVLVSAFVYVVANMVVDAAYTLADPQLGRRR